jgi:phosphatidylserine decarboxylase
MKIHKEGKKIIPIAALILLVPAAGIFLLAGKWFLLYILGSLLLFLFGMVVWFFREPEMEISIDNKNILSVSDGEVVVIEPHFEREYFKEERIQVSVFMSVFNVHINRLPVSGRIVYRHHRNGRFLPAFIAKSSEENERCTTVIKTADGHEILVRQIAGLLARRVITYPETGQSADQGTQLGFIRFGSRVDIFLPKSAIVKVKLNQKVFGGKSVIATFE